MQNYIRIFLKKRQIRKKSETVVYNLWWKGEHILLLSILRILYYPHRRYCYLRFAVHGFLNGRFQI